MSDETAREIVPFVVAVQSENESAAHARRAHKVVDEPCDKLEIEPALLSLVCESLNEKRKGRGQTTIDAALLKATGNTIIGDFYQHCVADVPDKTRRFIEDDLITEGGFRNSYPLLDALERARSPSPCCASWWIAAYCASTISSVSSVWNSSTAGSRTWCASTGTGSESACGAGGSGECGGRRAPSLSLSRESARRSFSCG